MKSVQSFQIHAPNNLQKIGRTNFQEIQKTFSNASRVPQMVQATIWKIVDEKVNNILHPRRSLFAPQGVRTLKKWTIRKCPKSRIARANLGNFNLKNGRLVYFFWLWHRYQLTYKNRQEKYNFISVKTLSSLHKTMASQKPAGATSFGVRPLKGSLGK